MKVSRS